MGQWVTGICLASRLSPRPRSVPWRRPHLSDPRQRCRQGVFRGAASYPERPALPTPPYSDDVDSLTRHHQGVYCSWLLAGVSSQLLSRLQSVFNDAGVWRLVNHTHNYITLHYPWPTDPFPSLFLGPTATRCCCCLFTEYFDTYLSKFGNCTGDDCTNRVVTAGGSSGRMADVLRCKCINLAVIFRLYDWIPRSYN